MKVLRTTGYPEPVRGSRLGPVVSTVAREVDLKVPIEQARRSMLRSQPGTLLVCDLFDAPDRPTIEEATRIAERRRQSRLGHEENHLAVCFYWTVFSMRLLSEGGNKLLSQTKPSPICSDELASILRQIALHPDYKDQVVVMIAEDWKILGMHKGRVAILGPHAKSLIENASTGLYRGQHPERRVEEFLREIQFAVELTEDHQ